MPKSKGTLPEFSPITGERTPLWAHGSMFLPPEKTAAFYSTHLSETMMEEARMGRATLIGRLVEMTVASLAAHPDSDIDWSTLIITLEPDTLEGSAHRLVAQATTKEATPA